LETYALPLSSRALMACTAKVAGAFPSFARQA
jgi:hypothetical protein